MRDWDWRGEREVCCIKKITMLLMAGDIHVFHRIARERACQKSFNILLQRTNYKGIRDLSENLRKEENKNQGRSKGLSKRE